MDERELAVPAEEDVADERTTASTDVDEPEVEGHMMPATAAPDDRADPSGWST